MIGICTFSRKNGRAPVSKSVHQKWHLINIYYTFFNFRLLQLKPHLIPLELRTQNISSTKYTYTNFIKSRKQIDSFIQNNSNKHKASIIYLTRINQKWITIFYHYIIFKIFLLFHHIHITHHKNIQMIRYFISWL